MLVQYQRIRPDARPPERASDGAVGYDVYASRILDKHSKQVVGESPYVLRPGESVLVGIGIRFAVPFPCQVEVRPRSGLASKHDIELSNSPGTIDPDFRGEAGVLLRNRGAQNFIVERDMRVAQLIFSFVKIPVLEEAEELPVTMRGTGGFGSTGLKEIAGGTEKSLELQARLDRYYIGIAIVTAELSDYVRGLRDMGKRTHKFGCIIVKDENIISRGTNSFYPGQRECTFNECIREKMNVKSGANIEVGGCVHAEWMAITNLGRSGVGASTRGATVYINAEPCKTCAILMTLISPEAVVVPEGVYGNNGIAVLKAAGIIVRTVPLI